MTSPFNWQGQPSIFRHDKDFKGLSTGKTRSETATQTIERIERETGRNLGTQTGLSAKADKQIKLRRRG